VLGSGLLQIYPQAHLELVEKILSNNGAIVSEYFCKATPRPINFLQRNRIISGLSDGIVVVEAASRSGALVTARFGLEQGRVVFAMPGPVDSELSEGTNQLIRDGAILTRHYEDICEEILELNKIGEKKFDKDLSLKFESYLDKSNFDHDTREKVKTLWNLFSRESTLQYDLLIERLCLAPRELNAILSSLELADLVKALDGGIYAKS
jgi:DNA processing protein